MNNQTRETFIVVLLVFTLLGVGITNTQFISTSSLSTDARNQRTILHAAETDHGPIIIGKTTVASSQREESSKRYVRTYSGGPLYTPVIGYFSSVDNASTSTEAAEEDVLDGQSQTPPEQRLHNLLTGQDRQSGGISLVLSSQMQKATAEILGSRKNAVVALDVRTGAVLAMYSSPTFDPNQLASSDANAVSDAFSALSLDPDNPLLDRTISERYTPGSTFEVLTAIALVEDDLADPGMHMPSPASTTLPNTTTKVSNIESSTCGNGEPTLTEAFARSCNTIFVLASERLTNQQLLDVTNRFGFGRKSQILLMVTPSVFPADANAAQLAMSSIGQCTVQTTPLQMTQVAQTITNGGQMMTPYLIGLIVGVDSQTMRTSNPTDAGKPISSETASKLRIMMESVVSQPYGTGTTMALPGIAVATKTDTAETGNGDRTNAWAIGFAPADSPRIAFAVFVEDDDNNSTPHSGDVAGPIARALLETGLQ